MADSSNNTRTARWLLAVVVLLILYGSLFPFRFVAEDFGGPFQTLMQLRWARTFRRDVIANLLLYAPLGATLAWALPRGWSPARTAFTVTVLAALLSFGIETAQIFEPRRVASLTDIVLNAVGAFTGCIVALGVQVVADRLSSQEMLRVTREPIAAVLILLWVIARVAPFAPTFDWIKWKQALKPLTAGLAYAPVATLRHLAAWLTIAVAVRALTRRDLGFVVLAILVLATLAGRVIVEGRTLGIPELSATVLVLLLWPLLDTLGERTVETGALIVVLAAIILSAIAPFELRSTAMELSLEPLTSGAILKLTQNLERVFMIGALVWLLARSGVGLLAVGVLTAALLLGLEAVQLWIPDRNPSLLNPLLALAAAGCIALLEGDRRSGGSRDYPES
jgi:VanZ family protein